MTRLPVLPRTAAGLGREMGEPGACGLLSAGWAGKAFGMRAVGGLYDSDAGLAFGR